MASGTALPTTTLSRARDTKGTFSLPLRGTSTYVFAEIRRMFSGFITNNLQTQKIEIMGDSRARRDWRKAACVHEEMDCRWTVRESRTLHRYVQAPEGCLPSAPID